MSDSLELARLKRESAAHDEQSRQDALDGQAALDERDQQITDLREALELSRDVARVDLAAAVPHRNVKADARRIEECWAERVCRILGYEPQQIAVGMMREAFCLLRHELLSQPSTDDPAGTDAPRKDEL